MLKVSSESLLRDSVTEFMTGTNDLTSLPETIRSKEIMAVT